MMRKALFTIHRYTGLILGLLVAVVSATGSAVVFKSEIDRLLNPELYSVEPGTNAIPVEQVVQTAYAAYPNAPANFVPGFAVLLMQQEPRDSYEVIMIDHFGEGAGPWLRVHVDPYTGKILGARQEGQTLVGTLLNLHAELLISDQGIGRNIVGIGALALLIFCLTGAVLWWPGAKRVASGFIVRWRAPAPVVNYDLHKVAGVMLLIPMFLLALTGVKLAYPDYFIPVAEAVLDAPRPPDAPASVVSPGAQTITVDKALAQAATVVPKAQVTSIRLPTSPSGVYAVRKQAPDDPERHYAEGETLVWIDRYSGEILGTYDNETLSFGSSFLYRWLMPIHNGAIAGLTGRIIAFIAGLMPSVLFGTGLYVWWRRTRRGYGKHKRASPR